MSSQPRLSIGGVLRSASERIRAVVHGETLELVQLKAALSRSAAEAAAATSKAELIAALGRVMENAVAIAATQGVSRAELEGRLRPTAHSRSVFRQVSELRSSVARAARDGSVRVTSHLYPRRRVTLGANRTRKERTGDRSAMAVDVSVAAFNPARLHETMTIVTQRFLGTRSMPLTRVRSFTRVVPVARAWTRDAIGRGLRAAGHMPVTAAGSGEPAEIPTVVLSVSKYRSAKWIGQRPPRVPAGGVPMTSLASAPRIEVASRKEIAQWAVSAASQLVVERLVLPYLRRMAAQRIEAAAAGGFGQLWRVIKRSAA